MYVQNTKVCKLCSLCNKYTSKVLFHIIFLGITNYNDYVDSMRAAHHVRLLPSWTSGQNRCQDPDYW